MSFRKLDAEAIIRLAAQAGLRGIEWGGDVHVPPGDLETARRVAQATREAGLEVASYGSYLRLGSPDSPCGPEEALRSAEALGAPVLRVWAGAKGSDAADEADWEAVAEAGRQLARQASDAGLRVALEYHGGTLTDTLPGTLRLLEAIDHPALGCYWQPPVGQQDEACLEDLRALGPQLIYLHVFEWKTLPEQGIERRPLDEGRERWGRFLTEARRQFAAAAEPTPHHALLEFVREDRPEQLIEDAAALNAMLEALEA